MQSVVSLSDVHELDVVQKLLGVVERAVLIDGHTSPTDDDESAPMEQSGRWPSTDDLEKDGPESLPDEAVDEKVDARVDRQTHVAETVNEPQYFQRKGYSRYVGGQRQPESEKEIGGLADDEYYDDDDESQGVALRAAALGPAASAGTAPAATYAALVDLGRLAYSLDEARVEEGQGREGDEEADEEEEGRLVDEYVDGVVAEVRLADLEDRLVRPGVDHLDDDPLEESREVVEDGHRPDEHDHLPDARHRAVLRRVERFADGDVAVGGDDEYQPDRTRLGDGGEGPREGLDEGPATGHFRGHPVRQFLDGVQRLIEEAGDEVGRVGEGKHLKEEAGRATDRPVAAEDSDAEDVARQTEETEAADRVHVDRHLVSAVAIRPRRVVVGCRQCHTLIHEQGKRKSKVTFVSNDQRSM